MKPISLLLSIVFSVNCFGSPKAVTFTSTSNVLTGTAVVSIQVPGTYTTIDPTQSNFSGRQLIRLGMWFEGRAAGDMINSIVIIDKDNVVGLGANHVFGALHDSAVASGNQGVTLPPGGGPLVIDASSGKKNNIASGLYIVFTFQKAVIGVDTAVVNVAWDDGT